MDSFEHGEGGLLRRGVGAPRSAAIKALQRDPLAFLVKLNRLQRPQHLVALWITGSITLALVTFLCFQLGLNFAATAFAFLIVIVLLSLLDSFVSSAIFSVVAVGCLVFFFVEPVYSFEIGNAQDLLALAAFLITSLAVTSLMRCVRGLEDTQREQARLLDLKADAEARLRAVIDTVPVSVWSTLSSGENDFHNQRLLSYTGFSLETAHGSGWTGMLHSDDLDRHARAWQNAVETGSSFECESRLRRADGQYRWFLARAEPLRDGHGNIIKWYGTNVDIDDRKRAEEALRRSETYLAQAQKLSRTGSFGWNVSSGELFWSDETFRIFEHDPASPVSIGTVLERAHPDDLADVRRVLDGAAKDRQDFDVEHRLLMRDGSVKHLRVVAKGATDEHGNLQFVGAVMDITAQKDSYAELERSEQRYRDVFRYMPMGLAQIDMSNAVALFKDLREQGVTDLKEFFDEHPEFIRRATDAAIVEAANDEAVRMFGGKSEADLLGPTTPFWEAGFDTVRRSFESRFRGEEFFQAETKMSTIDGRVIDVTFASGRIGAVANKALAGFIDITERVRAQEMLSRVQADFAHAARVSMLGELTASIAHEVNQPLAAIATNGAAGLRWLARPEPDMVELRELTESVVADARRAADIVGRVRAMVARQAPEHTPLLLDDVIREALLFLRHELQLRGVTVSHHPAPDAPQVLGDQTQLQQVIVNLAINATQAMPLTESAQRRITITVNASEPAGVRCTVEDSGPGIEPEHLTKLFGSFFTTKESGMGMGLPICRSIIEAHGGRISADNESVDGGARFTFTLPAAGQPH